MININNFLVVHVGNVIIRITPSNGNRKVLLKTYDPDAYKYIATSGHALYLATSKGLLRSSDEGNSWNSVNGILENKNLNYVFAKENLIYVTTNMGEVYRSTTDGIDWNVDSVADTRGSFALFNTDQGAFALSYYGIYVSKDNGNTWNRFDESPNYKGNTSTIWGKEDIMFLGTFASGLGRSTDGGSTWMRTGALCLPLYKMDVVDNVLYGYSHEVHYSNNPPESWQKCKGCGKIQGDSKVLFNLESVGNNQILYSSYNKGISWDTILRNQPGQSINDYVYHNAILYLAMNENVNLSTDNGKTWSNTLVGDTNSSHIVVSKNLVFVQFMNGKVYYTNNDGNKWEDVNFPNQFGPEELTVVAADEIDSNIVLSTNGRISKTTDLGKTWHFISGATTTGKEFIINNKIVFGFLNRILVTDITGELKYSWFDFKEEVYSIIRVGNTMYASTTDGMWRTDISTLPTFVNEDIGTQIHTQINIFPNPSSGTITVQTETDTPYSYLIINQLGETVQSGKVEESAFIHQVPVNTLVSGTYIFISQVNGTINKQMFSVIK